MKAREDADARELAAAEDRRQRRLEAEAPTPIPAHVTDAASLSEERRALLEQAITRRRARMSRARALKVERAAALAPRRSSFMRGDVVRHPVWGEGEVMTVAGDTIGAFFPGHGEKLLKAKFLQKVM